MKVIKATKSTLIFGDEIVQCGPGNLRMTDMQGASQSLKDINFRVNKNEVKVVERCELQWPFTELKKYDIEIEKILIL